MTNQELKKIALKQGKISRSQFLDVSFRLPGNIPTKQQKLKDFQSGKLSRSEFEDNAFDRTTGNPVPASIRAGISKTESSQEFVVRSAAEAAAKAKANAPAKTETSVVAKPITVKPITVKPIPSPIDGKRGAKTALARRRGRSGSSLAKSSSSGLGAASRSGGSILNKKLG
jgi:hypothetical protein